VAEAQRRYTSHEFSEWLAFERVFGPVTLHERMDILFARADWLFAEANRDRKKRGPFKVHDFLIQWDRKPKKPADWRSIKEKMRAIAAAFDDDNGVRH
jgi:hypothetical protein